MKKYSKVISVLLCIALMVSCMSNFPLITKALPENLIINGGFENYDTENNTFESWKFFATGDNTRTLSNSSGKNGENSAVITSIDNISMAAIEQQFLVDHYKSYKVSVWLKATGDNQGVFDAAGWGDGIQLKLYSDDKSVDIASESIKTVMSWRKVSFTIDAKDIPESVSKLTFSVVMYAVRGCLYIDDAEVVEYNGEDNEPQYIYNSSFEDVENGKIYDWNESGRTDIFAPQISSDVSYDGNNSLHFNSTNKDAVVNVYQTVNGLKSTNRYLFNCYVKASTIACSYLNAGIRIGIEYTDSKGNIQNIWSADAFQQADDWTKIDLYFSVPSKATNIKAYVQSNCVEGTYYIDALNIKSVGKVGNIANNSFELFENDEFPFWTWYAGNNDNGENTLTQIDLGYEGKAAAISKSNLDNAANIKQTLDFSLSVDKDYIVTAYVKATYNDNAPWDMRNWGYAKLMVTDGAKTLESQSLEDIGPWKKLSVVINANELSTTDRWTIDFVMYGMTGVVCIDNVTTTGTESTLITETNIARNGNRAVAFESVNSGAVNKMYQPLYDFDNNTHYVLSVFVKTENVLELSYDYGGAKLEFCYTDENGIQHSKVSKGVNVAEEWTVIRLAFNVPENCTNPTIALMLDCAKGKVIFDDLGISELSIGDVNYDSQFNLKDLVCLKKSMAQITEDAYLPLGDLNCDTEVDTLDLSLFRKGLLNGFIENNNLEVWTTDSLTRVLKNDSGTGETEVSLFASKGEYESFQIVADTETKEKIIIKNISVSDFISDSGDVISSQENVTVYREHYVNCAMSSPTYAEVLKDETGEIPDALIPAVSSETGEPLPKNARFKAFPYELKNNECQPYFIDVKIPSGANAGDYVAIYTLHTDKGVKRGNITLKVWNITLPQTQIQGSYFLSKTSVSARKVEEAAKNRIFINAVDSNQEEFLNYEYGYNNVNLSIWSGADHKNPVMKDAPSEEKVKPKIELHSKNLKIFNYTADEITNNVSELKEKIIDYANVLHKFDVKQLITIVPTEELLYACNGKPAVDIWTILPKDYDNNIELIERSRELGCEIWTYNCMPQDNYSPKFLLDYPLINYRIHPGFINYSLDVTGFLYWAIDNYKDLSDPWTSLNDKTEGKIYNGDGILFYPGEDVGLENSIVPSLRAKAIRDGFEDYELCTVSNVSKDDSAKIASSFSNWTQDKEILFSNRNYIGEKYIK